MVRDEASRLRDEAAALELAKIREKYAALESDHQAKILELSLSIKTLHDLREGESELKDALAKSQASEQFTTAGARCRTTKRQG